MNRLEDSSTESPKPTVFPQHNLQHAVKWLAPSMIAVSMMGMNSQPVDASQVATMVKASTQSVAKSISKEFKEVFATQSPGWEAARQKRTLAIKEMQQKGILKIESDDMGNQFLALPWIPDRKIPYKSLSVNQRLINEVCAGALGELSKDVLLHSVDTAKTRRQAQKKALENSSENTAAALEATSLDSKESGSPPFPSNYSAVAFPLPLADFSSNIELPHFDPIELLMNFKGLYAGFPIVLAATIPQGGSFFLVKKGIIELFNTYTPDLPGYIASTIPIVFAVMAYWMFRTPAEVIKTQVQTGQSPNVIEALSSAKSNDSNGWLSLWKYYPVMLTLDIPFQIINFILYGFMSDAVLSAGFETSVLTRLFCGITCGMIAAGLTCPIDVCKTRIIRRDKEKTLAMASAAASMSTPPDNASIKTENDALPLVHTVNDDNPNGNVIVELFKIVKEEGAATLFLGIKQRLMYTGLANGIRLAAYGTSRMDLMMRSLDEL